MSPFSSLPILLLFQVAIPILTTAQDLDSLSIARISKLAQEIQDDTRDFTAKMDAEARGLYEILSKQAEGYKGVVNAAGGDPVAAYQLLLIEKLPELVKTQVEAIKNLKIDKITVWDSSGNNSNGQTTTANFVSGLMKSVPPLNDLFKMAGMNLPSYLKGDAEKAGITIPLAHPIEDEDKNEKGETKK